MAVVFLCMQRRFNPQDLCGLVLRWCLFCPDRHLVFFPILSAIEISQSLIARFVSSGRSSRKISSHFSPFLTGGRVGPDMISVSIRSYYSLTSLLDIIRATCSRFLFLRRFISVSISCSFRSRVTTNCWRSLSVFLTFLLTLHSWFELKIFCFAAQLWQSLYLCLT